MKLDQAVARYAPMGKMEEGFARGKMRGDPAYAAVLERVPDGVRLLDVGCGEGYLLALVHANRAGVELFGFDHDPRRLRKARSALGEVAELWEGDVRGTEIPDNLGVIAILDVLHYHPPAQQDAIVERLAEHLAPGGLLLVRDGRSDGGWRSAVIGLAEHLAVAVGRHKGDGVYFRPQDATRKALERAGLVVEVEPCGANTPFANVLFIGRRAG